MASNKNTRTACQRFDRQRSRDLLKNLSDGVKSSNPVCVHYRQLPVCERADEPVLKFEVKFPSRKVFVHTKNLIFHLPYIHLPGSDYKLTDLSKLVTSWNELPYKKLQSYWFTEDELRWEIWSESTMIGWWSLYYYE